MKKLTIAAAKTIPKNMNNPPPIIVKSALLSENAYAVKASVTQAVIIAAVATIFGSYTLVV